MKYSPQDIQQGNMLRQKAQSEPANFGTMDGAMDPENRKQRMAGQVGERVVSLMNDPNEAARTQQWMGRFGMSNEGFQFNQAKMMMSGGGQPQQQA